MTFSRPRAVALGAVLAAAAGVLAGCGSSHHHRVAAPSPTPTPSAAPSHHAGPAVCPLTGTRPPNGRVPHRRALAVKVENLPAARPQSGLDGADIVYEEPVEQGITRFIVIFQCHGAARVEPIRSARLVDSDIVRQYGHALLAHAGGIGPAMALISRSGLFDLDFSLYPGFNRDPGRPAPHNLYASTAALWADAPAGTPPPQIFTYSTSVPAGAAPAAVVHVPFSPYSDVTWRYSSAHHAYFRFYDGATPASLMDGTQIGARNVIVQFVTVRPSVYVEDPTGSVENLVYTVGSGPAVVYRNGVFISGRWIRPHLGMITRFVDKQGHQIPLDPGNTWVELVPVGIHVQPV